MGNGSSCGHSQSIIMIVRPTSLHAFGPFDGESKEVLLPFRSMRQDLEQLVLCDLDFVFVLCPKANQHVESNVQFQVRQVDVNLPNRCFPDTPSPSL